MPFLLSKNDINALKILNILILLYACNIMDTASLRLKENAFELRS